MNAGSQQGPVAPGKVAGPIVGIEAIMPIRGLLRSSEALPTAPEAAIFASAGEFGILQEPAALELLDQVQPGGGPATLVSLGCVSLAGAILQFGRSGARRARIALIETPAAYNQRQLDLAGIGRGGDGFVAQEAAICLDLCRLDLSPTPGARDDGAAEPQPLAHIAVAELLAKPRGIDGTMRLARALVALCAEVLMRFPDAQVVSFANGSPWSRRLGEAVAFCATETPVFDPADWRPSIEDGAAHFMSARPLLDYLKCRAEDDGRPVVVLSLGAGGRVSLLAFSQDPVPLAPPRTPPSSHCPAVAGVASPDGSAERTDGAPLYMDAEFYGRDNFFFEWQVTRS